MVGFHVAKNRNLNKELFQYFLFVIFTVYLWAVCFSSKAYASASRSVDSYEKFKQALADSSITQINVTGDLTYVGGQDEPLVIPRSLTINGGDFSLNTGDGGIVLGGNVIINNLGIELPNSTRNCLILNGHELTLNNVSLSSTFGVDIFCGELKDCTQASVTPGTHARLTITGSTTGVNGIYAGNFSDSKGQNYSTYGNPVTININSSKSGIIGSFYGYGGNEPSVGGQGGSDRGICYHLSGNR